MGSVLSILHGDAPRPASCPMTQDLPARPYPPIPPSLPNLSSGTSCQALLCSNQPLSWSVRTWYKRSCSRRCPPGPSRPTGPPSRVVSVEWRYVVACVIDSCELRVRVRARVRRRCDAMRVEGMCIRCDAMHKDRVRGDRMERMHEGMDGRRCGKIERGETTSSIGLLTSSNLLLCFSGSAQ